MRKPLQNCQDIFIVKFIKNIVLLWLFGHLCALEEQIMCGWAVAFVMYLGILPQATLGQNIAVVYLCCGFFFS